MAKTPREKDVSTLTHDQAVRLNNPTAEMASLYEQQAEMLGDSGREMRIARDRPLAHGVERDRDMDRDPQIIWNGAKIRITPAQMRKLAETGEIEIGDAQLVWRGKDRQDWSDLVINAPPLYIQEKVHPKAIIDDLKRRTNKVREEKSDAPDLFADFNGIADPEARAEFYQHTKHWQNRMILGDSLQVMASLAEREEMRGNVQCIYFDPPYGIKFNSNWQVSTMSRDVKDGKKEDVSREPEQVKAFRDTWKDGIHSYLTYLRDRLMVARELLTESGSIFVQIGDENVHRVRAVMDEVFGEENFVSQISVQTTTGFEAATLGNMSDFVLWYSKRREVVKSRPPYYRKTFELGEGNARWLMLDDYSYRGISTSEKRGETAIPSDAKPYNPGDLTSQGRAKAPQPFEFRGKSFDCWAKNAHWKPSHPIGITRLGRANRIHVAQNSIRYVRYHDDFPIAVHGNIWTDTGTGNFTDDKVYVVQTNAKVIERCILMATDPGDLVVDPTCGSGTTAFVAEQWGRRWVTIDTSRVALALARTRLMSARYPYYLLADSREGRAKEQDLSGRILAETSATGDIRQGFVYERAPHIMLKDIANNAEIDVIWEKWQDVLEPLRRQLNEALTTAFEEWEIPRDLDAWLDSKDGQAKVHLVSDVVRKLHAGWWEARIARQKEIDASIARATDVELLYDRPYEDRSKVRVAGPFTVESLSPHRVVAAREDTLGAELAGSGAITSRASTPANMPETDFGEMVLAHLRSAGVHQQEKRDTIHFNSIEPWPGNYIAAEGRYTDGGAVEKRAAILIGPEFGTLTRSQITAAAREASDSRFDVLIACAFNFDAQATDLNRLGPLAILKARMNPDLHMAEDLKNTGKGNLFVVFGEPDVEILDAPDGEIKVKVHGVDVFDPSTGEIRSDDVKGIAAWFIDTDYDEESFFVRHAYFLGANDPYKALKTALKTEIDPDAWETLYSDTSRPFARPSTGRIAVKVINHFGDEVLKVFGV
ncbi:MULTISPECIES: site-specific DNA-methyltransferase [Rhizobium]|uniref:site-specific DNA-methyltransferase (adenine-specific) n=1 Tax=Rhizobium leguminosarum bv. viciae TaxID=387 RepID=A0A8G2IXB9_RHILV|nr:site-specific DNA-methyltransferase [Rhizobium leguminosarum]NKK07587.1 site-specific DNA-methyltransferase [Rhizobium leguminosarum bv. viciae]NKK23266.1 site-specific DNA-methyltransferase [Rhizobium leguminosarum bv. viciae]TBX92523.1 site-specific DNA-methyltransferase [Rhizobium leguminosarum bv. viciae]TBZ18888.1 site-specific DNA-methyltransferase [Rhizobium leguminosarum bv. viciae]